jgi:DNA helicase-2/ATP-dependent DNA helicase PcrA
VVDVGQVKGLEFDYVILVDVSAAAYPNRDYPRRLLHVAATRAIHHLWVTHVGRASPILIQALGEEEG